MKGCFRQAYLGCLLGGAVGDALGYAVEFLSEREIFKKHGECGIVDYELTNGEALISDDTQMTLFTAEGLLLSGGENIEKSIHASYLNWLKTQYEHKVLSDEGLLACRKLYSPRAPGGTCLTALRSGKMGSTNTPINDSKGCGGVMRVAPVALYAYKNGLSVREADVLAAEAAAITHGNDLGYTPAAMLSHIIYEILLGKDVEAATLSAIDFTEHEFRQQKHTDELVRLIKRAVRLAKNESISDLDAINTLGEGWVAEETLAIAVFSAIRHKSDFAAAIIAAVNHKGDSDSTGAVCGNILGAYLGSDKIPEKYLEELELCELISLVADSLYENKILF